MPSFTEHRERLEDQRSELFGARLRGHMVCCRYSKDQELVANNSKATQVWYGHNSDAIFLLSPSAHRFELCCTHLRYRRQEGWSGVCKAWVVGDLPEFDHCDGAMVNAYRALLVEFQ